MTTQLKENKMTTKFAEKLDFKETNQKIYDLCVKFCGVFDQKDKDQKIKIYQPTVSNNRLRIQVSDQLSLLVDFYVETHWSGKGFTTTKPCGRVSIAQNGRGHSVGSNNYYTTYNYLLVSHLSDKSENNVDEVLKTMLRKCIERDANWGIPAYGKISETIKNFLGAN